jgi:predicted dithiol-disulfide oxidoreductase (DUF899 family)
MHGCRYPGESDDYREARDALLRAELALTAQVEQVAELRRALPPGGELKEDYVFEEGAADLRDTQTVQQVRLSQLFDACCDAPGKDTLVLINMMFAPGDDVPCPACNCLADGYDRTAAHLGGRVNFALVARAPIGKLRAWAAARNWRDIRLLSSFNNSFNADYKTETAEDQQYPSITVFTRDDNGAIRHFYSIETMWMTPPKGQDGRGLDLYWPLWQLLDLTPEGRGQGWYPAFAYGPKKPEGCCE